MAVIKQSFLSNLLSCLFGDIYDDLLKPYSRIIVAIGTCILCILIGLSIICHFSIVSSLLSLITGTSFLFIIYVIALIIVLDIEVEKEEPDYYTSKSTKKTKTREYRLTIVWGIILLVFGVGAIYFSNIYRKHYAFECSTFLVNHNAKVYHLDWDNDCEVAAKDNNIEKMKGYQINESYTLCEWCKEWAEESDTSYNNERL